MSTVIDKLGYYEQDIVEELQSLGMNQDEALQILRRYYRVHQLLGSYDSARERARDLRAAYLDSRSAREWEKEVKQAYQENLKLALGDGIPNIKGWPEAEITVELTGPNWKVASGNRKRPFGHWLGSPPGANRTDAAGMHSRALRQLAKKAQEKPPDGPKTEIRYGIKYGPKDAARGFSVGKTLRNLPASKLPPKKGDDPDSPAKRQGRRPEKSR